MSEERNAVQESMLQARGISVHKLEKREVITVTFLRHQGFLSVFLSSL